MGISIYLIMRLRGKKSYSCYRKRSFFPPPGDKLPLIFLLLKKCEMFLSLCDMFFQYVKIQNLVIQESSGSDISRKLPERVAA